MLLLCFAAFAFGASLALLRLVALGQIQLTAGTYNQVPKVLNVTSVPLDFGADLLHHCGCQVWLSISVLLHFKMTNIPHCHWKAPRLLQGFLDIAILIVCCFVPCWCGLLLSIFGSLWILQPLQSFVQCSLVSILIFFG